MTLFAVSSEIQNKRSEIDSLLKQLPTVDDQGKVDVYLKLSTIYLSISMDSSQEYARRALEEAKGLNNSQKTGDAYKLLGNTHYFKGEMDQVIGYYDSSLTEYRLANDSFGQAKVLNNLGIVYHRIGDLKTSIEYFLKSLDFKTTLQDSLGIANTNNNIGSIYYDLEEFAKAYDFFSKALSMSEMIGDPNAIQSNLNNMGLISQELGQHQKAISLFNRSLEYGERTKDVLGMADTYHNLGKSKVMLGRYLEGLDFYSKALDIYRSLGVSDAHTLNNMGQAYIELDYYNQALEYLNESLEKALKSNEQLLIRDVYQNLSVAYERMGKFDEAYSNYLLFNMYDDSIRNQNYLSRLEEISNKREIEKSQEQIEKARLALEKKEVEIQRRNFVIYTVIAGFIIAMIFVVILFRMGLQKQRINLQLMQQNEEVLRSQTIIKKINKALTESEEKLRSIFDVSPYAILVLDANHQIVDCNDTSLELLHAGNKRELAERSLESFILPSAADNETEQLTEQIRDNTLTRKQYTINRQDDSRFEGEITGRVIRNSQGEIEAFVVVINDITERLHFIQSLKEAKLSAEESDRLKTAFLANMSHEIRTPMNSIVGFSNLLNDPKLKPDKRNEFLSHILKSSNLLLSLIDDIIDISKIEAGQMSVNLQRFKVNPLVSETFEAFRDANANANVEYRLKIPRGTDDLECNTDPVRLRQILMNLLSNAAKFTQEGSIELGYRTNPQPNKPRLEFYVKDTGIGIEPTKQDLIFERFRQVDDSQSRKYGGTGLGLAISKRLVELLSGSIRVESTVGKGATFYFTIPFVLPEDKKKQDASFDPERYNWKGKRILIAEDENSNYELIKAALASTKADVMRARNGEEAVQAVAGGTRPDLVLMDIRMPKMNGYEATRRIKADHPEIPVIAITAYAMSEDESKSLQAGCDMYISKPIRPHKLLEVLNSLLS